MSQEGMDECWKRLAEKTEEDVLDKSKEEDSKRGACRSRGLLFWNGGVYEEAGREHENEEKIAGKESSPCARNITCNV